MSQKTNKDYWQNRFSQLEEYQNKKGLAAYREIEGQYRKAQQELDGKIARWYQRFADNNGTTMAEARKLLQGRDLEEFRWDVQDYIKYGKENAVDGKWLKQLENASARYHISRLEALKIQTQQSLEVLFGNQINTVDAAMRGIYTDGYYRTGFNIQKGIGVGWNLASLDDKKISKVISKPWAVDGKNFSERIWGNKEKLITEVHNQLSQDMILGRGPQKSIDAIAKKMNTSKYNAGRLVMTEEAYFSAISQKDCYADLGVEQYEIIATLDSHTSEICQNLDGKIFDMKDYEPGVTAPPFHVYCRSTTAPYFADLEGLGERAARGADGKTYYVPADMTYKEWKEKYITKPKEMRYNIFKNKVYEDIKNNYSLALNVGMQNKHIRGSRNFDPMRSELTVNPEELIKLYAGKSEPIMPKSGVWNQKERFTHTVEIGIWRDKATGDSAPTKSGLIHYSKRKGVHIIPANPKGK